MSFDYDAPAELFLAKRTNRENYRRFATAAEAIRYAVETLRTPKTFGAWLEVGDERFNTVKSSSCTKPMIIRCASPSDGRHLLNGPLLANNLKKKTPSLTSKTAEKRRRLRITSARGVNGLDVVIGARCCLKPLALAGLLERRSR
jgi:hypothetical protein